MKRARERGIIIGELPAGPRNLMTDVPGVTVGHVTIAEGNHNTGVTVIMPPVENPFLEKMTAACHVVNGFGKTLGLMQLEELGTTKSALVEQDTCRESPFVCLQKSHDNLIKFGCHD